MKPSRYFDHNAGTPLLPEVQEAMAPYWDQANPASRHALGTRARQALEEARAAIACALGARGARVIFLGSATQANNLFLLGAARQKKGKIIAGSTEHASVSRPLQALERQGHEVRWLAHTPCGEVDLNDLRLSLEDPVAFVALSAVSHETGVVAPWQGIQELMLDRPFCLFSDAAQALGKIALDFRARGLSAMTISGQKIGGPKTAALVLDARLSLSPLFWGGGQEYGLWPGTPDVAYAVGLAQAVRLAVARREEREKKTLALRELLEEGLKSLGAIIFGEGARRVAQTTYFSLPGVDGEMLVIELDQAGFCVASGSACSSTESEPSPGLLAMGVEEPLARGAVRVSLGEEHSQEDTLDFLQALAQIRLRLARFAACASPLAPCT